MAPFKLAIASSILLIQAANGLTITGNECPNGWSFTQLGGNEKAYCCYGSSTINNSDGFCCVHGSTFVTGAGSGGDNSLGDITKSCFPFCSTTASSNEKRALPSLQCVDKVPFSASDYSERVSAASKSVAASQTGGGSGPSTNSAAATGLESSSGASTAAAASTGSSASSSGDASPTKNAGVVITQGAMHVGSLVAAAAMLVV